MHRQGSIIQFPDPMRLADLPTFSADDLLRGVEYRAERDDVDGQVKVEVDGAADRLCFYGAQIGSAGPPLIYLEGDASQRIAGAWSVFEGYDDQSPSSLQLWAETVARSMDRTFIVLARPGVYGSSGDHQQRRRPREVALIDAALSSLKNAFGWTSIDVAGFSGGGHLVAALMSRRADIAHAVIASGNVSIRQRNAETRRDADITGYTDFVDPIDLVAEVARHPPQRVIVLTDPLDKIVSSACQTAYVDALRSVGVAVDHRFVVAFEPKRHFLKEAAILAAASARTGRA